MKERYKEMKKRIRVAVKRMICLITICAMVVGTCPLPVIAAEDEGVSNDVVTEVDSASADSATDDNSAPIDSSTDDNPASINSSTDDNPVPTDSSTDDDTTPTELTTDDDAAPTEPTTDDDAAPTEPTTDDDAAPTEPTTDEDATQSEPTTDEDATQPEPTTVVNPVDTIELTVNDVNVSAGNPAYSYNSTGRYFTVSVNGSANMTISTSERTEDVIKTGKELAEASSIMLVMEGPNGKQTVTGNVGADDALNVSASVSNTFELRQSGDYTFYTVVTDAYGNECSSSSVTKNVTIPSAIGVEIETPVLSVSEEKPNPETGICTSFDVPCCVNVNIGLKGLDGGVVANQRTQEIKEILSTYIIYFVVNNADSVASSLRVDDITAALIASNGNKVAYTEEKTISVNAAGTYQIGANINGVEANSVETTLEKLTQNLSYQSQDNAGNPYAFQKDIACWLSADSIYAGDVTSKVTDESGKEIDQSEVTVTLSDNQCLVHAVNPTCYEDKTYTVTFYHSGNSIYEAANASINLTFKRTEADIHYTPNFTEPVQQYQKEITYTIPNHIDRSKVLCYEVDENKEKVENGDLEIKIVKNQIVLYHTNDNNQETSTHNIVFEYLGDSVVTTDKQDATLQYSKLKQNIQFASNPEYGTGTFSFSEKPIEFIILNGVGKVTYYESNEKGEKLSEDAYKNLTITKKVNKANDFMVYAKNEAYADEATFYMTFEYAGNKVYSSAATTIKVHCVRSDNEIEYVPSSSNGIYEYGEVIEYSYNKGETAGGISCYQSDKNGNRLEGSNDLVIKEGDNGSFLVSGQKLSPEGKPFYVTIAHEENEFFKAAHQTFEFNVVKIELNGNINVHEVENGIFYKTRKMYVDVFISASHDNLTKEGVDAISFSLEAISQSEHAASKVMRHKQPVVSYDKNTKTYRLRHEIEKDFVNELEAGADYDIKVTAKYGVDYFKDFSTTYKSLTNGYVNVQKSNIDIVYEEKTELEYSQETKKIHYNISGENFKEYPVGCKAVVSGNNNIEIVNINNQGFEYKILKTGTAHVVLTVDDISEYDVHNKKTIEMDITVISPSNTDYTINGKTPEEFITSAVTVPGTEEKWYKENITFSFGKDNLYTDICYRLNDESEWNYAKIEEFEIKESMPTDYEYYFYNEEAEIYSNDVKPNMFLKKIGVDCTHPTWNKELVIDQIPSKYSDDTRSYFPTDITVTGYAGTSLDSNTIIDAGSGVEKVLVRYNSQGAWEEVTFEERYSNRYDLVLSENKKYGKIELKLVDYLGHESKPAKYEKEVYVDDVIPVVVAVNVDENGNIVSYDGTWTNQQLQYAVKLLEGNQVSEIHKYEWAFVLRGTGTQPEEITNWTEINQNDLKVVLGDTEGNKKKYQKKNGTLYFRAESNAGLTTTEEDILNQKKEIRIWQEDLEPTKVIESNKPDAGTGWYNVKTGEVSISFEYPDYDEKNCAPAIGIVYTLTTKTSQDGAESSETRSFFKGIVTELEDNGVVEKMKNDDISEGTITIKEDSIHTLSVYVEDAAGNKSEISEYEYKADFNVPDILSATAGGEDIKLHNNDGSGALYTKFSQSALSVDAKAEYGISEKQNFYMAVTQKQGGKEALTAGNSKESLNIEPCTRGYVYLCAVDGAGNQSEAWTDGIVVDNQAPTGGSQQEISIALEGMNRAEFFDKDVKVALKVADAPANDHYSGLKNVTYTLGRDGQNTESNVSVLNNHLTTLSWEQISSNHNCETDSIIIDAAKNESNHAFIEVTATDYAGNSSTVTKELQIDVTVPQIEILFEQNHALNETYYNANRVARINITELNFDPSQVNFVIYKDGVEIPTLIPATSSWTTTEGNVHTTYITFAEDGDYSFEVTCTDLAGNDSEKAVSENFTIDKTKPVVEVSYDNNNAWKDNYYNQARTATITVTEHNFNANDFEAFITPNAVMGAWTHNEDVHRVNIHFDQEQHYSYHVNYTDLAGNTMEPFAEEDFYIDMNSPVIQISGVEDRSANAGEVIPVVLVSDQNYDIDGVQITLQNSKGQQIAVTHTVTTLEGGYSYTLTNVNEQPDEIYTLTVNATDMSGNQSELTYRFSLNRNGSVYDLSQMSKLVEKAYVRHMDIEDLQIYEMNVNTVEEFNIIVTRNGKAINSIEKNTRPQNNEQDAIFYTTNVEGNDDTGYEYEYTIYRESFQQEGIYNIMFYSRDKAGNEVNNTLTEKQADITFVVDNSAPMVVVEGVEPGELYTEETKDVNVYVSDNFKLQEAYFELIDEDGNVLQTYNYMELAEEEGDIVTITLPSSNKKMAIQYYAIDVAGNDITTMPDEAVATSFMITTNAWIRYINNRNAVAGTVCAAVVIVAASGAGVFFRRRRKA